MISVNDALKVILNFNYYLDMEIKSVILCYKCIIAEDIIAPIMLPNFNNAAVDGFGFSYKNFLNLNKNKRLFIHAEIAAGGKIPHNIDLNCCVSIMTGAQVPHGIDVIVKKEDVIHNNVYIKIISQVKKYQNIRLSGEDVKLGEKVIESGTQLDVRHLGLLLALGINKIKVYKKPKIYIIATGSELIYPGKPLQENKVYYCSGPIVKLLMQKFGATVMHLKKIEDNFHKIKHDINNISNVDMIIVVGGISVGKFDFTRNVFKELGIKQLFYRGLWRPGKPLYFGSFYEKPIFGLPGNPVAAYTMTNIFIKQCLYVMHKEKFGIKWIFRKIDHDFVRTTNIDQFLQAKLLDNNNIMILNNQGSHMLFAMSKSNMICWLDNKLSVIKKGTLIKTIMI